MSIRQFNTVLAGDIGAKGLTALLVLALVRLLEPEDFAGYVFLSSLVILSATLVSGFFNRHYIITRSADGVAVKYSRIQALSSLLAYVCVSAWIGGGQDLRALAAGLFCSVAAATYDFRRTHTQKVQLFGAWTRAELLRAVVLVVLSAPVAIAFTGWSLLAGLLMAQAIAFLVATVALPPLPASRPDATFRLLDSGSLVLVAYFALVGIFGQLPVLAIRLMADSSELASFGSAFRYYGLLIGVVAAANVVVMPKVTACTDVRTAVRELGAMLSVAAVMSVTAATVGYFAIPFVDGGKYPDAPVLFAILCSGIVPGLLLAPLSAMFLHSGKHIQMLVSQLGAVMMSVVVLWVGIRQGAFAASLAVPVGVVTQMCLLMIFLFPVRRISQ